MHTCELLASGGLAQCWGYNVDGEVGTGAKSASPVATPTTVVGLSGAVALSAGTDHTCALLGDGSVYCWGYNGEGALGDGTTVDSAQAVPVLGLSQVNPLQGACNADLAANAATNRSLSNVCTPTELAIFTRDPTGSCLNCLFYDGGCLDDAWGDLGNECEDPLTSGTHAECLATLGCALDSATVLSSYCGANQSVTACETSALGACAAVDSAGLPATFSNLNVLEHFTDTTYASGRANRIVECAVANGCTGCTR
jgi:hypothetical protein